MKNRARFFWIALPLLTMATVVLTPSHAVGWSDGDAIRTVIAPAMKEYCLKCHATDPEADVDLTSLASSTRERSQSDPADNAELLSRVIEVLDQQQMPPEDEAQPPAELRQHLIRELKQLLRKSASHRRTPAHTPLRRMNRFQYNNAIIDLFELKCVVFTLPERMMREHRGYFQPASGRMADVVTVGSRPLGKSQMIEPRLAGVAAFPQDLRAEHGFDNRADHLSLSPLLMEQFLQLGQSITQSPDFDERNIGIWDTFFETPEDDVDKASQVRHRLKNFLRRAFRRPVDANTLDRYSQFVLTQLESGITFPDAMKAVSAATISSPKFLYLYDVSNSSDQSTHVDSFELASRLSFFLWGSIPDVELLDLAESGQLAHPDVLTDQIDRMLSDHRLKRFCDTFPTQWLQLDRIISSLPNREKFPGFYFSKYRDSMHMMLEPLLLFETVLIENQPITQLIDSDFTYRSKLLDEAYGSLAAGKVTAKAIGGSVTVLNFQRLPVTDRRNGGVITCAAVMTMTSNANRTQPITRGAWLATAIFNDPPKPPPADVPPLDENPPAEEQDLTLRERLVLHRQRSDCRGCHEQIDPLGFALENYNPIGQWRDVYENGRQVDASGTLFRKRAFRDVVEFKDAILAEKDRFTRAFAGHLMAYALARELTVDEQIDLDTIAQAAADDGYRFQALIKHMILSEAFRRKSSPLDAGVEP